MIIKFFLPLPDFSPIITWYDSLGQVSYRRVFKAVIIIILLTVLAIFGLLIYQLIRDGVFD